MLKKLEKLEEKANSIIEKIIIFISALYFKLMPKIVFLKWAKFKERVSLFLNKTKSYSNKKREVLKSKKDKAQTYIEIIKGYPVKSKIFSLVEFFKILLLKTPLKNHAHKISELIKNKINATDAAMDRIGKGQLGIAVIMIGVITVGLLGVIRSTNTIVNLEYPNRKPASVQEYAYKPSYKMFKKKTMKVMNIKVPIYRENVKQIRSVTVDFTVRTSTRFAKKYLEHYENQVKDYFFTTVEPVISSFPTETEGKEVLKEKISIELNNFLAKNNVEGEVEEVGISFIVAN